MGGWSELLLMAGPVLAFAIYELIKVRREIQSSKAKSSQDKRP
jgi:hypothetical protein